MTDNQPDNAAQDDATGNIEAAQISVGSVLREARVHSGLSVDEVSSRIKFAPRQIEALEADDFAHLPETAFLRGFVRSYARLLQLDPVPLLAALPHAPEESVPLEAKALTEVPFPSADSERKQNIIWLAGAIAVVIALALAAWLLGGKPKEQNAPEVTVSGEQNATVEMLALPETVPVSAVPDAEPERPGIGKPGLEKSGAEMKKAAEVKNAPQVVSPPAAPPGQAAIRMTFDADSWVEIKDGNGKLLLSQLNHAGAEQDINGTPPFSLVIGHAKAVHLYYKGQAVDLGPHTKIEVARLTLE